MWRKFVCNATSPPPMRYVFFERSPTAKIYSKIICVHIPRYVGNLCTYANPQCYCAPIIFQGNRWMFNSSEFTSLYNNTCGVIPTDVSTFSNLAVNVVDVCVQFYSNPDCSGEDIQLLGTHDTRELTQRGFHSPVRSFSHCNSKCVDNPVVRNAIGRLILEGEPDDTGFRLLHESGK